MQKSGKTVGEKKICRIILGIIKRRENSKNSIQVEVKKVKWCKHPCYTSYLNPHEPKIWTLFHRFYLLLTKFRTQRSNFRVYSHLQIIIWKLFKNCHFPPLKIFTFNWSPRFVVYENVFVAIFTVVINFYWLLPSPLLLFCYYRKSNLAFNGLSSGKSRGEKMQKGNWKVEKSQR